LRVWAAREYGGTEGDHSARVHPDSLRLPALTDRVDG
jgi:hypothetical protein